MKKAARKGFTIVELLIVIAVIAVLAAVMVPVMITLIDDAKTSADEQMTASLNKAIAAETGDIDTMSDALAVAEEYGYGVEKLTPTSEGNLIVWDSQTKYFAVVTEDGEEVYANGDLSDTEYLFTIISDESEIVTSDSAEASSGAETYAARTIVAKAANDTVFSYYLGEDFEASGTLTVSAGIDVGEHEDVSVRLSTGDNLSGGLIVNTAGGDVTVAADSATVKTYGTADSVTVSGGTVSVYGEVVGNLEVSGGTVTTQASSSVGLVYVTGSDAVVTATSGSIGAVASTVGDGNITASTKVVSLNDEDVANMAYFAGGIGTEGSPYKIKTADQFANIGNLSDAMQSAAYYYELTDNIDLREYTGSDYCTVYDREGEAQSEYAVSAYFQGELNGNDKTLTTNEELDYVFADAYGSAVFKDINFVLLNEYMQFCPGVAVKNTEVVFNDLDISVESEGTYITIPDSNYGLYTCWAGNTFTSSDLWRGYATYTISGCDVDVNLQGASYNAVFIGGGLYLSNATVKNSSYSGTFIGEYVNLVLGNHSYYSGVLIIDNVTNYGELYGTKRTPMIAGGTLSAEYYETYASNGSSATDVTLGTARTLSDSSLAVSVNTDGYVTVTEATTATEYYVLTFTCGKRIISEVSENSAYTFSVNLSYPEFTSSNYVSSYTDGKAVTVSQYEEITGETYEFDKDAATAVYGEDGAYFAVETYDGTVYYVFLFENNSYAYFAVYDSSQSDNVSSAVDIGSVTVKAYDSNDLLIATATCSLA